MTIPYLPTMSLLNIKSADELLTEEQRVRLAADLAEMARTRRLALAKAGHIYLA